MTARLGPPPPPPPRPRWLVRNAAKFESAVVGAELERLDPYAVDLDDEPLLAREVIGDAVALLRLLRR